MTETALSRRVVVAASARSAHSCEEDEEEKEEEEEEKAEDRKWITSQRDPVQERSASLYRARDVERRRRPMTRLI